MTSPRQRHKQVNRSRTPRSHSDAMTVSGSHQAYIRLGAVLFVLSGIPIYSNLSKKQILFSLICFSSYVFVSVKYIHTIAGKEFTFKRLFEKYHVIPWLAFTFGTALSFYKLFVQRKQLNEKFSKWKFVVQTIKRHVPRKRQTMVFLLKLFIFILFIIGTITDTLSSFFLHKSYISQEIFWYLVLLSFLFVYFTNWAVMYNFAAGFSLVIEINAWLVQTMLRQRNVLNLDTVLPVVEVDRPFCVFMAQPMQGRTSSSHRCSPWYVNIRRYRTLKRFFCQVQDFRLRLNQLYYIPVALLSFANACYLPIMFATPYTAETDDSRVFTNTSIFVGLVYGTAALVPYCVRQLVEDRDSYLRVEINKQVYIVSDAQTKNIMLNLSGCVKNRYPRSPCYFFDVNLEVLFLVVETSVLMATTFLVQNKA